MKTLYLFVALGCALLLDFSAVALPDTVMSPIDLNIRAVSQNLNNQLVIDKTNIVGSGTIITTASKSNTTNFTMDASSLLDLLANSYNTNFPAGTRLLLGNNGYGVYQFAISDKTGTNISFYPTVLQTTFSPAVISDLATETRGPNPLHITGSYTASITSALIFTYDDSAMTTRDGTTNKFTWSGLALDKQSQNLTTDIFSDSVTMNLMGGSESFRGLSKVIFSGTLRAKVSGTID
jgi:hypothetical protein